MAVFSLEALQAEQGDCILLHFGSPAAPSTIVVDGGPGDATYRGVLERRLRRLARDDGRPVELPLVVCSHTDDDHIGGVLALVRDIASAHPPATIARLWHNRPVEILDCVDPRRLAAFSSRGPESASEELDDRLGRILRSVPQGDDLYTTAREAGIPINLGFEGLVMAETPEPGYHVVGLDDLALVVIGPDSARIDALRKKWKRETHSLDAETPLARSPSLVAAVAGEDDTSITNLSSIVFIAQYGGRSILMTGDARGAYVVDGLERAGLLTAGRARVDVLKLPHHGSARNVDRRFFETVVADDYVISANGMDGNPDPATFDALVSARGERGYRIWVTNGASGGALAMTLAAVKSRYPALDLRTRPEEDESVVVDLDEPLHASRHSPPRKHVLSH